MSHTTISYSITRYGRYWAVHAPDEALVCVTVYQRGAREVVRRLQPVVDIAPRCAPVQMPTEEKPLHESQTNRHDTDSSETA
jgi:hypothetical protein